MTRPRYQRPKVRRHGKHPEQWVGRWHVYDAGGRKHGRYRAFGPTSTMGRAEAQTALDALVQSETTQTPPPQADLTLAQLFADVFMPVHTKWSIRTRQAFESAVKVNILPKLGGMPIKALTTTALQKHLIWLAGENKSREMIRRVRQLLHAALKAAVRDRYLDRNPADDLEIPQCKPEELGRSLTEAEVARLFTSLQGQDRLFFRILILCGARMGEVMALRREDIHDGIVTFSGSALFGQRGPTKTRKTRVAPLPQSLQVEITHWLSLRVDDGPLVFPSRHGTILFREGWPLWALNRARKAAGIPDLDYRMCRRTFATLYEGDTADVQGILGHSTEAMTRKHYKRAIPERQRAAVEELDRRISSHFATNSVKTMNGKPINSEVQ